MKEFGFIQVEFAPVQDAGSSTTRQSIEASDNANIVAPRTETGRIRWRTLAKEPEKLHEFIRQEATRLVEEGFQITHTNLRKSGFKCLSNNIAKRYEGGIVQLREDIDAPFPKWAKRLSARKERTRWDEDKVVKAAQEYIHSGKRLTYTELRKNGRQDLASAIQKHYEGGILELKEKFGIAHRSKRRNLTIDEFKIEAGAFIAGHGDISYTLIRAHGRFDLESASKKYPGGLRKFKVELGVSLPRASEIELEKIREEALKVLHGHGNLNQRVLRDLKRHDLINVIQRSYPDGMAGLRRDLGITRRHSGYVWTPEFIETRSNEFLTEHGSLSLHLIRKEGSFDLANAITSKYPGGISELKDKLGLQSEVRTQGYWTEDKILADSQAFVGEHSTISFDLLRKNGRGDLGRAIGKHFPGGYRGLRERLGLENHYKTEGHWTPDNIEADALSFYQELGELSHKALLKGNKSALASAISRLYPGGMKALREKIEGKPESLSELLAAYEQALEAGKQVPFDEFLKGEK